MYITSLKIKFDTCVKISLQLVAVECQAVPDLLADSIQGKIIRLVDGEELTRLMIKHNIGVQTKTKIEIKKLDEDFFEEN